MIDWSVEKTKIRFEVFAFEVHILYGDRDVGSIRLAEIELSKRRGFQVTISADLDAANDIFMRLSMIQIAMLFAKSKAAREESFVCFDLSTAEDERQIPNLCKQDLLRFGFFGDGPVFIYDFDSQVAQELTKLKTHLLNSVKSLPRVGRGYLLNAEEYAPKILQALSAEYQNVAWGITDWARQTSVENDELGIITQYAFGNRGLEVGAGSGRVTRHLLSRFKELTISDIIPTALARASQLPDASDLTQASLLPIIDDITVTRLSSDCFDVVMFWENGLGALLQPALRKKAVNNMIRLLKPGGRLILAVRTLTESPIDQLMIAAQTDLVMGIYHTFTAQEVSDLMPAGVRTVAIENGQPRVAGGHELFLIFERVK